MYVIFSILFSLNSQFSFIFNGLESHILLHAISRYTHYSRNNNNGEEKCEKKCSKTTHTHKKWNK